MFTIPYHTIPHHTTMCHVSRITCQMSHFTCHLSRITSQVSHITHFFFFFSFRKWWSSWWRVCYHWGLPHLVLRLVIIKNLLIPQIYLFQLVVVRFWSLKKANSWEFNFREIGLDFKCQRWQTSAAAESAPCAHFHKLDIAIKNFFSNLDVGIFPWVLWSLFQG